MGRAAIALCFFSIAHPAFADSHDWGNLQALRSGDRIGVVQVIGGRVEGRFAAFSDSAITLRADREISVPKDQTASVYRRGRLSRAWWTAIGAGIGLTIGAVVNVTLGQYLRNEGHDDITGAALAGGAGAGAALGALAGGHQTIYRRANKP